jgi:hypothetical protein
VKRNYWFDVASCPELRIGQYLVPNFVSNSVALEVEQGHWLLYSPGEPLLADWQARFGQQVRELNIIVPNHYHYLGLDAWLEVYPGAKVFASEKAIPRLLAKGVSAIQPIERNAPKLPQGYMVKVPEGHRGGDVWLCKNGDSNVWITCDSFMNHARLSNQAIARALQRLLGTAPGLKISEVVKWLILDDRNSFKRWALGQLEACPPEVLIPSHGEVLLAENLREQLESLLVERL